MNDDVPHLSLLAPALLVDHLRIAELGLEAGLNGVTVARAKSLDNLVLGEGAAGELEVQLVDVVRKDGP